MENVANAPILRSGAEGIAGSGHQYSPFGRFASNDIDPALFGSLQDVYSGEAASNDLFSNFIPAASFENGTNEANTLIDTARYPMSMGGTHTTFLDATSTPHYPGISYASSTPYRADERAPLGILAENASTAAPEYSVENYDQVIVDPAVSNPDDGDLESDFYANTQAQLKAYLGIGIS